MTELTIDRLHKSFGSVEVLTDINLHVKTGEFTVFVGPSGCGKSTLLRMVCGLDEVTAGSVVIDNEVVNDVPPSKRGIAMVFQTYALYPHMSVAQNMGYALKLAGEDKDEIARRVQRAAEILKIEDYLDRKPRQLSGGQRQRVAIGRAIVREPKIFLFDEPLSNLDAALRVDMRMEFARLKDRLGTTMIYVTHDQVEAMTLADKIVVMSAGRIEQVGSPLELYNAPRNRFVAGFIGSPKMNFLPILGHDGGQLHLPGGAMTLPQGIKAETVYSVGIRPEHVQLTESATNRMTGALMTAEHLGSDTFVYAEIDGVERPILARLGGERPVTSGETVTLGFETDDVHFFDKDGLSLRPSAMADAA